MVQINKTGPIKKGLHHDLTSKASLNFGVGPANVLEFLAVCRAIKLIIKDINVRWVACRIFRQPGQGNLAGRAGCALGVVSRKAVVETLAFDAESANPAKGVIARVIASVAHGLVFVDVKLCGAARGNASGSLAKVCDSAACTTETLAVPATRQFSVARSNAFSRDGFSAAATGALSRLFWGYLMGGIICRSG